MSDNKLTPQELADRWDVSINTLQRWRVDGVGPRYLKLHTKGSIRYRREDIEAYERDTMRDHSPVRVGEAA